MYVPGKHELDQMLFKLNYNHAFRDTEGTLRYTQVVLVSCLTETNGHTETYIFASNEDAEFFGPQNGIRPGSYEGEPNDHARALYDMGVDIIE
jgi:hypothetical protein